MRYLYLIVFILTISTIFIITGNMTQKAVLSELKKSSNQDNICEELSLNLDSKIIDNNNPPGNFIIGDFQGIVGGTLINISSPYYSLVEDENQNIKNYNLTFKGINKTGKLYLRTNSSQELPYKEGLFYSFNLKDKNQFSIN